MNHHIEPQDDLAPWEQLPGETDKAYDRFITYLELGADRSLEKVRQNYGKSTVISRQKVGKKSAKPRCVGGAWYGGLWLINR